MFQPSMMAELGAAGDINLGNNMFTNPAMISAASYGIEPLSDLSNDDQVTWQNCFAKWLIIFLLFHVLSNISVIFYLVVKNAIFLIFLSENFWTTKSSNGHVC